MKDGWYSIARVIHVKDGVSCFGGLRQAPVDESGEYYVCICGERLKVHDSFIPLAERGRGEKK